MILKKGSLVMISSGDYSDYQVNGLFRVLHDFDVAAALNGYKKSADPATDQGFIAHLAKSMLIDEDYTEIHLEGYQRSLKITGNETGDA